ncbi:MAG: response regulator transcription factor [Spartobacteria bacterium]|nr:response regulator transcription factor [Spartobacteria bacterium]
MTNHETIPRTILLVDDHDPTREEIYSLIERQQDFHIVGEAGNGVDAVQLAERLHPDLIVMDINMPEKNGFEATREICASDPNARILAFSNHTGEHLIDAILAAGALGFVRKDHAYEELLPAMRKIVNLIC